MTAASRTVDQTRATDLARQIGVLSAAGFMLVAAMVGTGLFGGTPVQDLQNGALDVDGSYLAPARPAFSIWSVIYVGLILYAVWQALPGQRADRRQRALGGWIALTMVLNGLWLVAAQFATLPLTVLAIAVLLVVLCVTFRRLTVHRYEGWPSRILIDLVTGLHLGWVTVATVANVSAWLTRLAPESWAGAAWAWGIAVLIVVAAIGLGLGAAFGWRMGPALAIGWGATWLGVARLTGEPESTTIGVVAILVAVVVVGGTVAGWFAWGRRRV